MNNETATLKAQLNAAQKACAEMRELLSVVLNHAESRLSCDSRSHCQEDIDILRHALSNDCGKNYVPKAELESVESELKKAVEERDSVSWVIKEQVKPLVEALRLLEGRVGYNELPTVTKAIAHAKQLGL